MLLRKNYPSWHDLRPVHIDPEQLQANRFHSQELSTTDPCFKQLNPGASVSWEATLPSFYFDSFQPGEFFEIMWVGGQIHLWDWGTLADHSNRKLNPKSPPVVLPGGPRQSLSITAEESDIDDVGPLPPSPGPILADARMSGAPVFSLSLVGPATLSMKDRTPAGDLRYPVTVTLSYDAAPEPQDGKPVTIHTFVFKDIDRRQNGFRLYYGGKDQWSPHELGGLFTHHDFRFSTSVPVNVGHNDQNEFVALKPGQSWTFTREVSEFPKNVAPGDEFRYGFKGATLDWWDWGHYRDHEDTVVWINAKVRNPTDNGGRPELVVPASNWVEFTLIE
ncbi:hypothetical protein N7504_010881 [Penicillium tannophilum]|nr:hypothetical protein N7504_010881 [Penicillium tannophilum]